MTKKENRQIMMDKLAKLFNANTGKKVGSPCRGKYRGTTDYSVVFDNGKEFIISQGMKDFDNILKEEINKYSQFHQNKQAILNILFEMEKCDNSNARARGLNEYKIIDIDYSKNDSHLGWFYLTVSINGKERHICETNFNMAVSYGEEMLVKFAKSLNRDFRIAGGLSKSEVDFIFHGYGYSSTSNLYTL